MSIDQKARSLYAGMQIGRAFCFDLDDAGRSYMPLNAVPFELEGIFVRWTDTLPLEDQSSLVHFCNGEAKGVSVDGWERFLDWMLASLRAALEHGDLPPDTGDKIAILG